MIEERNEIVEIISERWFSYYGYAKFYDKAPDYISSAERLSAKYHALCSELAHILSRVIQKDYEDTYNGLVKTYELRHKNKK